MELTERQTEQLNGLVKLAPPRFKAITPNFDYAEKLAKGNSFLVTGTVGTGKTRLLVETMVAWAFTRYFLKNPMQDPDAFFINENFKTVANVLRQIKDDFDAPEHKQSIVEKMIKQEVLFLDDLGSEKASEWVKEQLYIVINERYNWVKPVFITTNLTLQEIAQNYGDRLASRLYEMAEQVKLNGVDRRLTK